MILVQTTEFAQVDGEFSVSSYCKPTSHTHVQTDISHQRDLGMIMVPGSHIVRVEMEIEQQDSQ